MTHYVTGEHFGSFRRDESETELRSYRFGRCREKHGRGLSALLRANSYLKNMIHAIADAKFRRMLRQLELRGTRLDMRDELWIPDALRDRETAK